MNIEHNVPLRGYSTFKIGGTADHFVVVETVEALRDALLFAKNEGWKTLVIGGGSNVLFSDEGFEGLVIKNNISGIYIEGEKLTSGAGESWDALVEEAIAHDLWGLENLSGIPGSVGATPIQNVGAYGVEVGDLIVSVETMDREGNERTFLRDECHFAYRDSFFKSEEGMGYIITKVHFALAKNGAPNLAYRDLAEYFKGNSTPTLSEIRKAVIEIRGRKFSALSQVGTAGSFFKNPIISKERYAELQKDFKALPSYPENDTHVKIPLGWIIDNACGLKGLREGDVGTHDKQSLVLVNYANASAKDVKEFAEKISECVKEKTNIDATWEVRAIAR